LSEFEVVGRFQKIDEEHFRGNHNGAPWAGSLKELSALFVWYRSLNTLHLPQTFLKLL